VRACLRERVGVDERVGAGAHIDARATLIQNHATDRMAAITTGHVQPCDHPEGGAMLASI
jgi:hypothetical protein